MNTIIVLIPHFNSLNDLLKTLKSINEKIAIDILIVDDGSDLKPKKEEFEKIYKQGKLFIEILPENLGIEKALNFGLEIISKTNYEFIGRLDCGDLCMPNKFTKQFIKLNNDKDLMLLGTWAKAVDSCGNFLYYIKPPIEFKVIKKKIFLNSTFVHPTVVFRKSILEYVGYYPENYKYAEDYAFWFKIIKKFKVENLPEYLLDYEINSQSISSLKRSQQVKNRIKIILKNFYFGYYPIYGLFRNFILLFFSRKKINKIKTIFKFS